MRRTIVPIGLALLAAALPGADLVFTGTWMATHSVAKGGGADAASMDFDPGATTFVIDGSTITSTMYLFPGDPPEVVKETYTVKTRGADAVTLQVVPADAKDAPKPVDIVRSGTGLTLTEDGWSITLVPLDRAALAAVEKRNAEAKLPADPLKQQPLAGTIAHAPWTPVGARRSRFQLDEAKHRISVNVFVVLDADEHSAQPVLLVSLPTAVGVYPFSDQFNITAVITLDKQIVLVSGALTVTRVTPAAIDFGITARGMDGIVINGTMTADVTPVTEK